MLLNIIGFQIIWFGLIFLGTPFVLPAIALIAAHFVYHKQQLAVDLCLMSSCILIGLMLDSLLMHLNVMSFEQHSAMIIPVWLIVLWAAFGLTLNHSLKYFRRHKALTVLAGGIFGALSYMAGERFGAVQLLPEMSSSFITFALIWAPLFFALTRLSTYLERYYKEQESEQNANA